MEAREEMEQEQPQEGMQSIAEICKTLSTHILHQLSSKGNTEAAAKLAEREKTAEEDSISPSEWQRQSLQSKADDYNRSMGYLNLQDGIDCPVCKNKGFIEEVRHNDLFGYWTSVFVECKCKKQRACWARIKRSGLSAAILEKTFDSFETDESWQKEIVRKARAFLNGEGGQWFYIGGQVGCGKSHICTAICGEVLNKGDTVKYMRWAEDSVTLKAKVNDENYPEMLNEYKDCDLLYIDDFFKVQRNGNGIAQPSGADVKLAFQILDYRYCTKKPTVISSEWLMDELMDFDEAVSSRVYQMSKGSTVQIARDSGRNYRRQVKKVG